MKSARKCSTLLKWLFGSPVPQYNLLQVHVAVNFNNIVEVDEKKNLITVDLSLWLDWVDRRVKSLPKNDKEYVTVIGNAMDHFWIPDIYEICWKNFQLYLNGYLDSQFHCTTFYR